MLNVGKTSVGFCVIEGGSLQGKWSRGLFCMLTKYGMVLVRVHTFMTNVPFNRRYYYWGEAHGETDVDCV